MGADRPHVIRDLRAYARQTNVRLAIGAFVLLFGIGLALVYLIYGPGAALTGFLCLLGALVPVALIVLALFVLDRIVKRGRAE
jgi:hypothetical protein